MILVTYKSVAHPRPADRLMRARPDGRAGTYPALNDGACVPNAVNPEPSTLPSRRAPCAGGTRVVSGNADHLRALADGVSRKLDVIAV